MSDYQFGWRPDPRAVDEVLGFLRHPVFSVAAAPIGDSGKGKVVLLHKLVERVRGSFPVHRQTIGDCVSHGWGLSVDVVRAVQIAQGARERYAGDTATEPIYAGSRVEIGGGRIRGDGSVGAWAAKLVSTYGTLIRGAYGSIDLSEYDGARARDWGRPGRGIPDPLEPTMREHLVHTVSLVDSYEAARDAIANGYPVAVCSNQGFASVRDAQGFARPKGTWGHCMMFVAVDDADARPGLLCCNSWGPDWISGPKRHEQPEGSFWVDAQTVDRMLRQGDSFAVSQYEGYPAQDLDYAQY